MLERVENPHSFDNETIDYVIKKSQELADHYKTQEIPDIIGGIAMFKTVEFVIGNKLYKYDDEYRYTQNKLELGVAIPYPHTTEAGGWKLEIRIGYANNPSRKFFLIDQDNSIMVTSNNQTKVRYLGEQSASEFTSMIDTMYDQVYSANTPEPTTLEQKAA